jgi:hypothetical protein
MQQSGQTYGAQGDRGGSEANKTTVAGMREVDGVGIFVAQLLNRLADLVVFFGSASLSDEPLKPHRELVRPTAISWVGVSYSRAPCFRLS